MYTSVWTVRSEAGFDGNPDVTDEIISSYIDEAHAIVSGYIAGVYSVSQFADLTRFDGSQAEQYLWTAEKLIAAGLLLKKEFSQDYGAVKDGNDKEKRGRELLMWLTSAKYPTRLVDIDGLEFSRVWSGTTGGLPILTLPEGNTRKFDTSKKR